MRRMARVDGEVRESHEGQPIERRGQARDAHGEHARADQAEEQPEAGGARGGPDAGLFVRIGATCERCRLRSRRSVARARRLSIFGGTDRGRRRRDDVFPESSKDAEPGYLCHLLVQRHPGSASAVSPCAGTLWWRSIFALFQFFTFFGFLWPNPMFFFSMAFF